MTDASFVIKSGRLIAYNGEGGDILIPEGVEVIGEEAFQKNNSVTSVTFPEGVKEIESSAFEDCAALRRVYIPRSLTRFDAAAFSGAGVREVHITDLATWCESYFSYATANPLGCGADLYLNGERVCDLVIPDGVTSVASKAFLGCRSIKSVTLPDSVTKVWDSFENCKNLETIRYGNGLTFEAGAYSGCENIKEVYVDSIEAWCRITFNGWGKETPLHSGATLYIGGVPAVDLVIPDGIRKIGSEQFYNYKSLKSISFPDGIRIEYEAFRNCSALQFIEFRGDGNFDTEAFKGCSSLIAIKLPEGYRVPLWNVLREYTDAKYIGSDNVLKEQDGFRYAKLRDGTYLYRWDTPQESLVLPESLGGRQYEIANSTFKGCDVIKSITIPEGAVSRIGYGAFSGCNGITEVTVPAGIELENSVFAECQGLKKASVSSPPGTFMFENCRELCEVVIAEGVTHIGSYTFRGCHALTEVTVPASTEVVGNGVFQDCTGLKEVTFADPEGWRRTTEYVSYNYRRASGEPFDVSSPTATAATVLGDGNDWYYFKKA